ncbi:hypothetical protein ACHAXT_002470 [Thalassiosira profunda]
MSGKDEGISPVRVSRLKKRRRPHKDGGGGGGEGTTCALQHLSPATSAKQTRHCGAGEGHASKENLLNGRFAVPSRPSAGRLGVPVGEKGEELGAVAQQQAKNAMRGAPPFFDGKMEVVSPSTAHASHCPNIVGGDASAIGFITDAELSSLTAAIPSLLGLDMQRYDASSSRFRRELEQAFGHRVGTENDKRDVRHGIYHPLVGRIDPHPTGNCNANDPGGSEVHYIAFPRCTSATSETAPADDFNDIFQHLNLMRKSGHGMMIPASWYQFPSHTTKPSPSPGNVAGTDQPVEKKNVVEEPPREPSPLKTRDDAQPVRSNVGKQSPKRMHPPPETVREPCTANIQSSEARMENTVHALKPAPPPPPMKSPGKIQIESEKGATIREVFDIDNSDYVIGKLHRGDERHFLEKRTLPPPPISLDDSDEESDDECVAVVRYKIVLRPEDYAASEKYAEDASGQKVGWISDRGRLADEPYLILREV